MNCLWNGLGMTINGHVEETCKKPHINQFLCHWNCIVSINVLILHVWTIITLTKDLGMDPIKFAIASLSPINAPMMGSSSINL